ncbi:hypothetical protein COV18_00150 [Candidatus Woesearchaeota archaeon CG10_big_fil_rev_8_21_14_0_10_37_12]|nr:MAG: hypothetical protein COV18_00150 [Candidatus Woesearchaeota archaeon CG10_big_fil_rev_8_21_14_0_10_37_12]
MGRLQLLTKYDLPLESHVVAYFGRELLPFPASLTPISGTRNLKFKHDLGAELPHRLTYSVARMDLVEGEKRPGNESFVRELLAYRVRVDDETRLELRVHLVSLMADQEGFPDQVDFRIQVPDVPVDGEFAKIFYVARARFPSICWAGVKGQQLATYSSEKVNELVGDFFDAVRFVPRADQVYIIEDGLPVPESKSKNSRNT